ncbi:MAG: hypothetical protein D6814_13970, partial [Calditrichaeota bacterium]
MLKKQSPMHFKKYPLYYPVLVIFLVVVLSLVSLAFYTVRNLHREEQIMYNHLTNMGLAFIQLLESSTAVGMMGMSWQQQQMVSLFEQFSHQKNIEYLHLLDNYGRVLVSSRAEIIGTIFTGERPDIGSSQRDSVR